MGLRVYIGTALIFSILTGFTGELLHFEEINYDTPEERPSSWDYGLDAVAYGDGVFVATGDGAFASTNGVDWVRVLPKDASKPNLTSVTYAQGRFVAVGGGTRSGSYFGQCLIVTSEDGFNWNTVYNGRVLTEPNEFGEKDVRLCTVSHGPGGFVALGLGSGKAVLTSPDGIGWTKHEISGIGYTSTSVYGNGIYLVGGAGIQTSINGTNWNVQTTLSPEDILISSCYSAGLFVFGGSGNRGISESTDATNWVRQPFIEHNFHGVAGGGGEFIAVASSAQAIVQRTNVTKWASLAMRPHWFPWGICYGNGQFIAVGEFNLILRAQVNEPQLSINSLPGTANLQFRSKPRTELQISDSDDLVVWNSETNILTGSDGTFDLTTSPSETPRKFYRATLK